MGSTGRLVHQLDQLWARLGTTATQRRRYRAWSPGHGCLLLSGVHVCGGQIEEYSHNGYIYMKPRLHTKPGERAFTCSLTDFRLSQTHSIKYGNRNYTLTKQSCTVQLNFIRNPTLYRENLIWHTSRTEDIIQHWVENRSLQTGLPYDIL